MTIPFYVSPEQQMKDRADYARKGIARGRTVVVFRYDTGICFVADNQSQTLHKISEIYDRLGFAAVGRYNEFESLRIAGIRHADLRGYSYDRTDVTGRGLANAYAQVLGAVFSNAAEKPLEVELIVAELGVTPEGDQLYRLTYDGSVIDQRDIAAMGHAADDIVAEVRDGFDPAAELGVTLPQVVGALRSHADDDVEFADLEVAVLDRARLQQRKFARVGSDALRGLLGE